VDSAHDLKRFVAYHHLGEASVSPDGSSVVHVESVAGKTVLWCRSLRDTTPARRLWVGDLAVNRCLWCPDAATVLLSAHRGGSENYQLLELDVDTGEVVWSTDEPRVRHEIGAASRAGNQPYAPGGQALAYSLNARNPACFDVAVRDRSTGRVRTVLVGDDRYSPICWSPDGDALLIHRSQQNIDHDLFVYRFAEDRIEHLTPHTEPTRYLPGGWSADGRGIYLATNAGRDVAGLAYLRLVPSPELTWLDTPDHEVDYVTLAADRGHLLWAVNRDGYTELRVRDLASGTDHPVAGLPRGVAAKEMGRFGYAPQLTPDGRAVITPLGRPTAPPELYRADLGTGTVEALTEARGEGLPDPSTLVEPEVIRYPSDGGVRVPALLYRPAGAGAPAPCPAVISIHGGPEYQAFPAYDPLHQYLLSRGIAVLEPNYRGSTGFGRAYQRLIYRDRGGADLADFGRAADYLAGLDWVDANRIGLYGASYGGFAVLSCLSRLPNRWAAAAEFSGRSDLTTIARTTPAHWRHRLADWVGDPVADADMLAERSPINHAHDIHTPLLVGHGENDPRVPRTESDRIVQRLRALGRPVRYVLLSGEGHNAADPENALRWLSAVAEWFVEYLLPT
jgi:dipeptidyl aminopeptidase/acylaminoacyl peptidase